MSTDVKEIVKEKYGEAARRVRTGSGLLADCCSKTSCCEGEASASRDPITSNLYDAGEAGELPEKAVAASIGCGNPTALAELKKARRGGSRPGFGRRHRRVAIGKVRRPYGLTGST